MKKIKAVIFYFLFIFLTGCNLISPGTNTGNPSEPTSGTPAPLISGAEKLIIAICEKISNCYSSTASEAACKQQVKTLNNYTSPLGTINQQYPTISDLISAETVGTLTANTSHLNNCVSSIQQLNCNDSLIISGYTSSTPNEYGNTKNLFQISSDCGHIY